MDNITGYITNDISILGAEINNISLSGSIINDNSVYGYITNDASVTAYVFSSSINGVVAQFAIAGIPILYMYEYVGNKLIPLDNSINDLNNYNSIQDASILSIINNYISDVSVSNQFYWDNGILYVDVSSSGGVSQFYVDGSLYTRDSSIIELYNLIDSLDISLNNSFITIDTSITNLYNYNIVQDASINELSFKIKDTFENVSKNLKSYPSTFYYNVDDVLTSIIYITNDGSILKTLNYANDKLDSIVLSGDVPNGIELTKKMKYIGDTFNGFYYY
jgi:hypothetical protein